MGTFTGLQNLQMIDVGGKAATRRRAVATGTLRMSRSAFALLRDRKLPKGDALALGEVAGVLAAKNCAQTIPLCHPLPLDRILVSFSLEPALPGARARCEVSTTAKTGVEMEALSGVNGALLAVYDLVKQVDPALTISDVRLELKEGGKSGAWRHPEAKSGKGFTAEGAKGAEGRGRKAILGKATVITVSDRCSRGEAKDKSGPLLAAGLKELGFKVGKVRVVPDERPLIGKAIAAAAAKSDVVALTGGTGLSPRDVTPEAVAASCDRLIPGIGEALRAAGAAKLPQAVLSRSAAGLRGKTLVVALPGSTGGVRDGLAVLAELLPHALHVARGGGH